MPIEKSSLQNLIECIEKNTSAHVCIHDVSGILQNEALRIKEHNQIHFSPLCNAAKTTDKGLRLCFACKGLSVKKAFDGGHAYAGACPLGLTEIAVPLYIAGKPMCIIYIGNLNCSSREMEAKINRVHKLTKADKDALLRAMPPQVSVSEVEHFIGAAGVIKNYISLIYTSQGLSVRSGAHWAVSALNGYAQKYYQNTLTLRGLSRIYYLNENYLGRLYKKQTGKSFSTHLNEIRLEKACALLRETDDSVIAISLATGFNNVTYFNRIFKRHMGVTPTEYRAQYESSPNRK